MIGVNFNTDDLEQKLKGLAGQLTGQQMGRAIALGINKTLKQARTQSDRDIRKVYNVRQSFVLRYIKLRNASNANFTGLVLFPTKTIPLGEFMKSRVSKRGGGIKVEILRGKPQIIKGGFLLKSKFSPAGAKLSVMHRSNVNGTHSYSDNFNFRHKRVSKSGRDLPIGAMFSSSPLSSVFNPVVKKNISQYTETKLQENIFTTLDKMAAGYIREANNRGGRYRR